MKRKKGMREKKKSDDKKEEIFKNWGDGEYGGKCLQYLELLEILKFKKVHLSDEKWTSLKQYYEKVGLSIEIFSNLCWNFLDAQAERKPNDPL